MALEMQFDGEPGPLFQKLIRSLPDGKDWLVSDINGNVIIARHEGELVREAILSTNEAGAHEVECLVSEGVEETRLEVLVILALASCGLSIIGSWFLGPGGLMGLVVGVVFAGTIPAGVLAIGQRMLDPGRDSRAEAQLERSLTFAVLQASSVTLNTDG